MKRFVVISDLHIHPWSAFAKGDGLHNTRLRRSLNLLEASLLRAQEEDIPWLFAGDLVHTAGYALNTVLAGVTNVLVEYPDVQKIVVWGNHDARGVGGKITVDQTIYAALACAVPMIVLDPSVYPHGIVSVGDGESSLSIGGAGYQPRTELLEFPPGEADVGLFHQTIRGSITANDHVLEEGLDPAVLRERYRLSIVGHVHQPQQISAPTGQGILIPGSPEQQNFGDKGDHGWWVVTLPDHREGNPLLDFVPGGSPEFRTVDSPTQVKVDGHFYRVRNVARGIELPEGAVAVAPSPTSVEHRDLLRGVTEVEPILQTWLKTQPPAKGEDAAEYLKVGKELLVAQDPRTLRDVRLSRLQLHNFCCFADQVLQVQRGLWLITGRGKDYPSNGAGKSSLVGEALYWLLFGRTTKGLGADEVVRWGEDECVVTGVFEEGEVQLDVTTSEESSPEYLASCESCLVVTRRRGPEGHTLSVLQDGYDWEATSVNEMTAKLGAYLGLTPEIFQNLAYFSQEKLLLFSSATDGERKNVLADLVGLSAYQEAATAASGMVGLAEKDEAAWLVRVEENEKQLVYWEKQAEEQRAHVAEWREWHCTTIGATRNLLEEARAATKHVDPRPSRIKALADALIARRKEQLQLARVGLEAGIRSTLADEQREEIEALERKVIADQAQVGQGYFSSLDAASAAVAGLPEHREQLVQEEVELVECARVKAEVREKHAEVAATNQVLAREQTRLGNQSAQAQLALAAGFCPTCQQAITAEHREKCFKPIQQQQEEVNAELATNSEWLKALVDEVQDTSRSLEDAEAQVQRRKAQIVRLERVQQCLLEVQATEREIAVRKKAAVPPELVAEKVDAEIALTLLHYGQRQQQRIEHAQRYVTEQAAQCTQAVARVEHELNELEQQQNPHTAGCDEAAMKLAEVQRVLQAARAEVERAQQRIRVYDYWRAGFSKTGLQSLLVEEIAVAFNANRSNIFPLLTQGVYDVQFSTLSHTRSGKLREKTEFLVFEHGELVPYGALSGGQRRRIDIGIMLVLTQAVAQWMGTRGVLGLLILDEVFGFLDASGAEGLLAALNEIGEQVPTIYVITHDTNLQSLIPNVIHVVQGEEGTSQVMGFGS
jgi:DNA repair exonuclease SbcCD ATPase subunit/DNA repair exonuclease SbcCD nuclease subunit